MSKKFLIALAAAMATGVVAITPALAQASVGQFGTCATGAHTAGCPAGMHFTGITTETAVKGSGTETFTLAASGEEVSCATLGITGDVDTTAVNKGTVTLSYSGCTVDTGVLAGCPVEAISGVANLTNSTTTGESVAVKLVSGFDVIVAEVGPCPEENLGPVTGETTGTIKEGITTFSDSGGLEFLGEPATITGKSTLEKTNGEKIYVQA